MSQHDHPDSASTQSVSRREFLGTMAAGAVAGPTAISRAPRGSAFLWGSGPDSKFGGVQIGAITYSFRSLPSSAEQLLGYLVECGISSTELMGDPILEYLGAPTTDAPPQRAIERMSDPDEREAALRAREAHEEELRRWYASPPMEKLAALRRMYNDAGVTIHLAKFAPGSDPHAAEFAYRAAAALGARGVTNEIGEEACRVQGPVAARHGLTAAMHNHGQPSDPDFPGFDHFLAISPGVSLNLDFGHYYGFTGRSPLPEIERLHDRITSMHMKDKAAPPAPGQSGDNLPWGQGSTPIADVLRLVQRAGYPINCDIELEYEIPAGSNAIEEVKKCVEFCREVLT
ncbi:MAG TPA: sugar phosphate isomerase/epimerase [Longimicrobiaceae bacterium]